MRVSTSHMHNTGVQNMTGQQSEINESHNQLSSGKRVLRPSDDPSSAARILDLERTVSSVERFNRNNDMARNRLSMSENAMEQVGNNLQRIRELTVQAANDSQDPQTRGYIASEIKERYEQLLQLSNSRDGNGEYLFAGAKTKTRPFSMEPGGQVEYHGDQNSRQVRVGPGRQIGVDNSGFEAFMKVPNGNGKFQAYESRENNGSGVINVVDQSVHRIDPQYGEYRLQFVEDDYGDMRYMVERRHDQNNPEGWELVQPPAGPDGQPPAVDQLPEYAPGSTIEVEEGVRVQVDGSPEQGDTFTVSTSRPQSIFETVHELIGALEEDGEGPHFRNAVNRALGDVDLALENVINIRSQIGARLSTLDSERASNEAALVDLQETISTEEDLDYAEATGRFNKQLSGLEAAQATFGRVQNLSLFNYI
ncbi:flagellar hook-associated protein FlgL [Halorhodospira halochloris]|uniref:Flagellar hook-associated protein FlgL n=1 Tax=Halorhodospira halochloris TaxID=1052 RepID=A0A0X8XBZ1_HALHR|nr:flagellar hook-associated protein FlgL [Halorhodospira halochloris]MCG5530008.1 flagellar hook-associated protein FlgL [Halorhodospira halochloris]BAU58863.1 flagellar hook-associated protein FlgL [Halorhodospira halochloris]